MGSVGARGPAAASSPEWEVQGVRPPIARAVDWWPEPDAGGAWTELSLTAVRAAVDPRRATHP